MMKIAMNKVADLLTTLQDNGKQVKMLVQVHDELLFEVAEDSVKDVVAKIKKVMEDVAKLSVPVVADVKVGDNWGGMSELKVEKL